MELIAAHGGKLIDRVLRGEERNEALEKARTLRKLEIDSVAISDLELIAVGVFSPLTGFMKKADYDSVVTDMRLDSGVVWSIPITLSVSSGVASSIDIDEEIALTDANASILAILRVEEKFGYDKGREAENVYRTTETAHPGVARLYRQGDILLGGEVFLLDRKSDQPFSEFRHDPCDLSIGHARSRKAVRHPSKGGPYEPPGGSARRRPVMPQKCRAGPAWRRANIVPA